MKILNVNLNCYGIPDKDITNHNFILVDGRLYMRHHSAKESTHTYKGLTFLEPYDGKFGNGYKQYEHIKRKRGQSSQSKITYWIDTKTITFHFDGKSNKLEVIKNEE